MLRSTCFFFILLPLFHVFGQTNPTDTLDAYFEKLPDDGDKVKEMALKGHSLARTYPDYAIGLGQKAIHLAKKLKVDDKLGSAHNAIGYAFIISGQQDSAEWHYNKSIEIAKELSDSTLTAQAYLNLSTILRRKGEYEKGINYLFIAQRIYEARSDSSNMASVMINIGIFHSIQQNFSESIRYYKQAVKLRVSMGQENKLGNVYNNLGIDNELNGNMDSALYFYGKSLEIRLAANRLSDVSASYNNLSVFFRKLNQNDTSLQLAKKALEIGKQIGSKRAQFLALRSMSNVLIDLGRNKEAEQYLTECLEIAGHNAGANSLAAIYESLSSVKERQGQDKQALKYYKLFKTLYDSATGVDRIAAIKDAEEKFESEKKDKQITQLELEQQTAALALAESKNQRNILIGSLAIITVAAVLLFIFFRQKRRSLAEKELLLKEIHHRVKNNLQVISSLLNLQADSLGSADAKEAVMEGQSRVKSMALIHQKLYSADDVRGVDLQDYLENLSSELFRAFGVDQEKINWEVKTGGLKLDIDTVIPLGLIINELITNALKYAFKDVEKGLLLIEMDQQGENLNVLIKDNGKGMDEEQIKSSNSFGWKMINSLGRKLKAEIAIKNDNGTEVALMLSRFKLVS